ncbi:LuxR C-terminal-related transcriptional regulator [Ideonella livida]|uniref:Response regulator transcription factor n=1 Tax=Ideonella livida TaxID=2707176 RepID=A0A7C9TJT9_9BURK|nr:response regulator transcription factor [Ideonella livida]NDY90845.1 response regulator transcription factor [Ideonella livida]
MKCLLVDDHALFREALTMMIEAHHPAVTLLHADHLADALRLIAQTPDLDLVLLDLSLADSRGLSTLHRTLDSVGEHGSPARVIVLSGHDQPETMAAALEDGAAGFISKRADFDQMEVALRKVMAGGIHVPEGLAGMLTDAPAATLGGAISWDLTPRQSEVLEGIVAGWSNKRIAQRLALSESTVKTHVQAIFDRLGIRTRTQAVVLAAREGWRRTP